jgi:hypothetical protein
LWKGRKTKILGREKIRQRLQTPSNIEATQDVEVVEQQTDDTDFPIFFLHGLSTFIFS